VRRADRDHQVSGFELFFDFMAAFAFAQVGHIVTRNPGVTGALHALLILGSIYGCWLTYCWAANNARADFGALRYLHVAALFGLILLGLTLPGAFADNGLDTRVLMFLAAYLIVRVTSASALYSLFGRAAATRACLIIGFGTIAAGCIATAVHVRGSAGTALWAVAVACEIVAITASATGMRVKAPAHLAERFAFLVILGLDMSLSGVCAKFAGTDLGVVQVALIIGALLACTVMWWLYFDTLTHYAEHRLHHAGAPTERRERRRFIHLHYTSLHLVILAGMVSFGLGLRTIAETMIDDTTNGSTNTLGPDLTPLTATSLTLGLATYLAGITAMWTLLRRPTVVPWLISAAAIAATPFLIGLPAIEALAVLITITGLPILTHALAPTVRAHRRRVHHETGLRPAPQQTPARTHS
jgi:low temperature requirement protein LtrA